MQETAWYHRWFGADYLQLYQHRSLEEAAGTVTWLIDTLDVQPPARVLDLACGNGRHGRELASRGFETYGLDLSWPLLKKAELTELQAPLQRVRGDMRNVAFKSGSFALILSLFTSFGYFKSEVDDQAVLKEIARLLTGKGFFVLDFLNAPLIRRRIVPSEETLIEGRKVTIFRWLDERNERVEKRILIHEPDGAYQEYRESVRLYSEEKLRQMLRTTGFKVRSTFGDYQGSTYQADSPRLILIGQKNV